MDNDVTDWVRLTILGDIVRVPPMLWISSQRFERRDPEYLIVLPEKDFHRVSRLAASKRCQVRPEDFMVRGERRLLISMLTVDGAQDVCILPNQQSCQFLNDVEHLVEDRTAPDFVESIALVDEVLCSHDR